MDETVNIEPDTVRSGSDPTFDADGGLPDLQHFELQQKIGSGGMGTVFEAYDSSLDRQVAVKVLPSDVQPDAVIRFVREARMQAKLSHANIVQIYYIGKSERGPFFAMERVHGESLHDRLHRETIPWAEAIEIALQVVDGLEQAAKRGLIHRDIKPANLLVTEDGLVKIADFGIAKAIEIPDIDSEVEYTGVDLTHAGLLGTPHYAAPEQALGNSVDHRADMYALGVTLFELVTGSHPFDADNIVALVNKHVSDAPPVERLPDDVSTRFREVVTRLLEKKPEDRFATYDELREALVDARPFEAVTAEVPIRLGAGLIEFGVAVVGTIAIDEMFLPVFTALYLLMLIVPSIITGRTWGQKLTRIRPVDAEGNPPSTFNHIIRGLVAAGGFALFDVMPGDMSSEMSIMAVYYFVSILIAIKFDDRLPQDLLTRTRVVHD